MISFTDTAESSLRFYQIGNPQFTARDPCLNCQLPICEHDRGADECKYLMHDLIETPGTKDGVITLAELRELNTDPDDQLKKDLIEILQALAAA